VGGGNINNNNSTKINVVDFFIGEGSLSGQPLHIIGASIKTELMFNLGVSLLHARKPEEAFDCLIEAVQTYHMNPKLWLRLAECCITTHKKVSYRDGHEVYFRHLVRQHYMICHFN